MLWSHHHILLDGWSMPIVMEELLTNYEKAENQCCAYARPL
ncbi:hypothetical protein CS542_09125 [Pedobacter sp. IW39]|nr:hypothetical protein CS542_09125 [Pedobacter sp. IW39]